LIVNCVDQSSFRDLLGLFATGVTVIATQAGGEVHAITVNSVASLSLDPMLVLFCPSKRSRFAAILPQLNEFSINILRDEQRVLSTYFAGSRQEAQPPPFRFVPDGDSVRLEGSLAAIMCRTRQIIDGGDHWLVIGAVTALHRGIEPHRPLLFFKGQYRHVDFAAGTPAPDLSDVEDEPAHIFYEN
jgi:flavin reductase (DIM6/NTAB) family NADH-FMN oxidoreductase RutF